MRSPRVRAALLVIVALIVILSLAAPILGHTASAQAPATPVYVALGDSYAAGEGLIPYLPSSSGTPTRCNRSPRAYPSRVAAALGATLLFRACGGADTTRMRSGQYGEDPQLAALTSRTTHVSVTVGGNDIDFIRVAGRCTFRSLGARGVGSPCKDADDANVTARIAKLRPNLEQVLRDVRTRAPQAQIVVTTYPRVFPTTPAAVCTVFTPLDQVWANGVVDRMNAQIRAAAEASGARVADVAALFEPDHVLCGSKPYVGDPILLLASGASFGELSNSLHPTADGQAALATAVRAAFRPNR